MPPTKNPSPAQAQPVDLLILGLGWTSQFLLPLLAEKHITHAGTTRDGRNDSIAFTFDPTTDSPSDSASIEKFARLPSAGTVLITFPLKGRESTRTFLELWSKTHTSETRKGPKWIQLGSTGIYTGDGWRDESSPRDQGSERGLAEDELLSHEGERACILNLAGLHGGGRDVRNWIPRVAKSKSDVKGKGAVHLIHGVDVARAVVLCMEKWGYVCGRRWILTDLWTNDWWGIIARWGKYAKEEAVKKIKEEGQLSIAEGDLEYENWVRELMVEEGVRALPRGAERLGRLVDGRGFWNAVGSTPEMTLGNS